MNIYESGWIHEDDNGEQGCYATPHEALVGFLRLYRGSCDDDTDEREIDILHNT